jgi:hypothetical protein
MPIQVNNNFNGEMTYPKLDKVNFNGNNNNVKKDPLADIFG